MSRGSTYARERLSLPSPQHRRPHMGVIDIGIPKEREPGPYAADRFCNCGAKLSRYNPSTACAPCSGGDWISPEASPFEIRRLQRERFDELGGAAA